MLEAICFDSNNIISYLIILFAQCLSTEGTCNHMPFYEYSTVYSAVPNTDRNDKRIWIDDESKASEMVYWRVKRDSKVEYVKIHNVQTNTVQLECMLEPPPQAFCCLDNIHENEIAMLAECSQKVFKSMITENDYRLAYVNSGGISWKHLVVTIYLRTPQGMRRYFFGWPHYMKRLVCSEIASMGNFVSPRRLEWFFSGSEQHKLTYAQFYAAQGRVLAGETIMLSITAFLRPGDSLHAYVVSFNEDHGSFSLTALQGIAERPVQSDVYQFTESVQLMPDYTTMVRQKQFGHKLRLEDRAVLVLAGRVGSREEKILYDLFHNWIVKRKPVEFVWSEFHSPGIRILPVMTAEYSVATPGRTIKISVSVEQLDNIICSRYDKKSGTYVVTKRLTASSEIFRISMPSVIPSDTGIYQCGLGESIGSSASVWEEFEEVSYDEDKVTDAGGKQSPKVLDHQIVIVLPEQRQLSIGVEWRIAVPEDNWAPDEEDPVHERDIFVFTEKNPPFIVCAVTLSAYYDNFEGLTATDRVVNLPVASKLTMVDSQIQQLPDDKARIVRAYTIDSHIFGDSPNLHRASCVYQYTPSIGLARTDYFTDPDKRTLTANLSFYYVRAFEPDIFGMTINTSSPGVTSALRQFKLMLNRTYNTLDFPSVSTRISGELSGAFQAVGRDSVDKIFIWTASGIGSDLVELCKWTKTKLTSDVPKTQLSNVTTHGEYMNLWHYQFVCQIRETAGCVVLSAIDTDRKVMGSELIKIAEVLRPVLCNLTGNTQLMELPRLNLPTQIHRLVVLNSEVTKRPEVDGVRPVLDSSWITADEPRLLDRFIHSGQRTWRAVDFHRSGSVTRLLEDTYGFDLHAQVESSNASFKIWAAYKSKEGISVWECDASPTEVMVTNSSSSHPFLLNTSFSCALQAEYQALIFLAINEHVPKIERKVEMVLINELSRMISYWLANPNSTVAIGVEEYIPVHFTYLIQKLNLGWHGIVPESTEWSILLSGTRNLEETWLRCWHFQLNMSVMTTQTFDCGQAVASLNSTSAKPGDSGVYKCIRGQCGPTNTTTVALESRLLLVYPTVERVYTYFAYVNKTLDELVSGAEQKERPRLAGRQPGFIYCMHASPKGYIPLNRVNLRLMAKCDGKLESDELLPFHRVSYKSYQKEHGLFDLAQYDITQHRFKNGCNLVIARCFLQFRDELVTEYNMNGIPAETMSSSLLVEVDNFSNPVIFREWINTEDSNLRRAISMATLDPLSYLQIQDAVEFHFHEAKQHTLDFYVSPRNTALAVHLYFNDGDSLLLTTCVSVSRQMVTRESAPQDMIGHYEKLQEAIDKQLLLVRFKCHIKPEHVGLSIIIHTDAKHMGEVEETIHHLVQYRDRHTAKMIHGWGSRHLYLNLVYQVPKPPPNPKERIPLSASVLFNDDPEVPEVPMTDEEVNCG
ncbi:hypothetical protein T265_05951 [Opisthorchis viverrini]|uniref:Uncharacterized protein n=1 Tax=Opisthorchis viverrini TaxID=6198 RepID=A0A074ZU20_OPIVI|nr:hypothetical protein T265_05951 [Opisthorchis viverrini]KER26895.1 hypothetical protein T265_05951 [Opisthorchis viverrini]